MRPQKGAAARLLVGCWRGSYRDHMAGTWVDGDAYEGYIGRWSREVAPEFLRWLGVAAGKRWLDVGCGTGALSAAILETCSPSSVTGVEPSEGFIESAKRNLAGRVALYLGSATSIPLKDSTIDVVVSGLVLNFVSDTHGALTEMARVATPGAIIGAYVWDYADKMELLRYFWDAAAEAHSDAAALDEDASFPLCHPDALLSAFAEAGLTDPEVRAVDVPTPFANFAEYWTPFLGGQGPAAAYAMSLDDAARERLRGSLEARIPTNPDGSISLIARAWAVKATVLSSHTNW
jgi:SAM-dependent methyltransferase